jgi:quercetin dioxygenase-like cupin family protein
MTTQENPTMDVQPSKSTSKGPANWFTGEVWIDPIARGHEPNQLSLGNVRFTPGARTAWHSHTIAQTLYVTDGEGLVQARGEAVIKVRPGDVVNVAGHEWHWHGAAPDRPMTHLSLTEGDTEWGDHVTDVEYHSD